MNRKSKFKKKIISLLAVAACCATVLAGCGGGNGAESSPPVVESTPEVSTPEEIKGETYNITYDFDGGIDGGNPATYNSAEGFRLIAPVKVGYNFVGWTGTGLEEATVSVVVEKGVEGDLSFTANWEENDGFNINVDPSTDDALGRVLLGYENAYVVVDEYVTTQNLVPATHMQDLLLKNDSILYITRLNNTGDHGKSFCIYNGMTEAEETQRLVADLAYNEYAVSVQERSMCVIGWTEAASNAAWEMLGEIIDHVAAGGRLSDYEGAVFKVAIEDMIGKDTPRLKDFDSVTDVGDGAFQVYAVDSSLDAYNEYISQLEGAGYVRYTENILGQTRCATYYNEDTVVSVQFGGGDSDKELAAVDRSLRIVVEPFELTNLPPIEAPEDADSDVAVSKITLMYPHNLCMVVHLSNGHFIIVDSGNNGRQKALSDFLRANSPDKDNVIVDAWIFTHFHQDHIGGFVDYMAASSLKKYITVKNIIYNFPQKQVLDTASSTDQKNIAKWNDCVAITGATVYQARTGQRFYFGNAMVEILWTYEDIMPHNITVDRSNPTCIGFSITVEGQKLMVTGDSSAEELQMAQKKYGDYLKSDFVQLSHHGKGDGTSPITFYSCVNAPYVFNPNPKAADNQYGYGEDWAVKNSKKFFHSGNMGTVTVPLPYAGDESYTKTK